MLQGEIVVSYDEGSQAIGMLRGHAPTPQHKGRIQVEAGQCSTSTGHSQMTCCVLDAFPWGNTRWFLKLFVQVHASWEMQDFSQPQHITCNPITHLLPAPGCPQPEHCQGCLSACPTSAACPPLPAPWESPEGSQRGSASGKWATQSCKSLLSSRALEGILIRVKIISSIFWLRKQKLLSQWSNLAWSSTLQARILFLKQKYPSKLL